MQTVVYSPKYNWLIIKPSPSELLLLHPYITPHNAVYDDNSSRFTTRSFETKGPWLQKEMAPVTNNMFEYLILFEDGEYDISAA